MTMQAGAVAAPFDMWLRHELRRAYNQTLAERVPPDLLRLLDGPTEG